MLLIQQGKGNANRSRADKYEGIIIDFIDFFRSATLLTEAKIAEKVF
jgi:hypothetical protein